MKYEGKNRPFHDNCDSTFIRDICECKNYDFAENRDVISAFISSMTSFYWKGYFYHSQMSRMNTGPQLSWKGLLLLSLDSLKQNNYYIHNKVKFPLSLLSFCYMYNLNPNLFSLKCVQT
jgi:hypothetical protein